MIVIILNKPKKLCELNAIITIYNYDVIILNNNNNL